MSDSVSPPPSAASAILVVDDEPMVLTSIQLSLEREGFSVVACSSPLKALAILAERDFAVIISDHRMPEMLGLDFLIESRRLRPLASRILITGVLSLPTIVDAINKGEIFRFVAKPWLREELIATVRNAIQRHELVAHNEMLEGKNQRLEAANRELGASYEHSLELCRRILTAFDPILGGESKVLVELAKQMAGTEHFTDEERHALQTSAWLCDIGLVGVPREMLRTFRQNADRLTTREIATLHYHPVYSQTLAALVDSRPSVGEVIRAHHERFDGRGFPDGLAGNSIPWPARCLAVAVGFVESGLSRADASEKLLAGSGSAYDPEAVRLFLKATNLTQLPRQVHEVLLHELQPGMVLANGIYSPHGLLLVGESQRLSPQMIAKILSHNEATPISHRLLVYT